MHKIVICSHKGGVGKTTTALNLACGIALSAYHANPAKPSKVLLVDMDPQGNSSLIASKGLFSNSIPAAPTKSGPNLANLLVDDSPPPTIDLLRRARIPTTLSRPPLDYIAVNIPEVAAASRLLETIEAREYRLAEGLAQIEQMYKYCVIDTGTEFGGMLLNALTAANFVIIPVELTGLGVVSISDTLGTVKRVQRRLNPELKVLGILPSKCNFQRSEAKEIYDIISNDYPDLIFEPIRERAEVSVAVTESLDIFSYRPPRRSSDSYVSAAQSVQEYARFVVDVMKRVDQYG